LKLGEGRMSVNCVILFYSFDIFPSDFLKIHVKDSAPCLAYNKYGINVTCCYYINLLKRQVIYTLLAGI
jgi:hypothetical protein